MTIAKTYVLFLSLFFLVSCFNEPTVQTSTPKKFRDSIERLISKEIQELDKGSLRNVFNVALATIDYESLPQEKIIEFNNLTFSEFRDLMFERAVVTFSNIKQSYEGKLDKLENEKRTTNTELLVLQTTIKSAIELDKQDVLHFDYLTNNLDEINKNLDVKCKEIKGSKDFKLEIVNRSRFSFYVGQIYAEHTILGNNNPLLGLLGVDDSAYTTIERNSTLVIPVKDLSAFSICDDSEFPFSFELLTAIGDDSSNKPFFIRRELWTPRQFSTTFKKANAQMESIEKDLKENTKLIAEAQKMIQIGTQGMQTIGFMQLKLLAASTE